LYPLLIGNKRTYNRPNLHPAKPYTQTTAFIFLLLFDLQKSITSAGKSPSFARFHVKKSSEDKDEYEAMV
jgi:hypothetical protein